MIKTRIVSLVLTITVLINVFSFCAYAEQSEMDVYEYSTLIQELTNAYLPDSFASTEEIIETPLNRLIVKTDSNEPLDNDYGAADKIEGYNGLHILQYETESQTEKAFASLTQEDIEYVEYDFWLAISDTFNYCYCEEKTWDKLACDCSENPEENGYCTCYDTSAPENHLSWNSSAIQVDEAFELIEASEINCETVTVAVLDTGVYAEHEYFKSEDVENSRICIDSSYEYVLDGVSYPSDQDDYYHGTHVAGIIYDNTMDNVNICSYRLMGTERKALSCAELTGAIDAAVKNGVDIISMSLRRKDFYKNEDMKTLKESIENAINQNVVLVAAAGNEANDANVYIPARYEEVITVSATTRDMLPDKNYSSYGDCVDIGAPGTDIYSTAPRIPGINDDDGIPKSESLYMRLSGTSMATPLVSAAAATLKSIVPDITPEEVKRIIKETAYVPEGWDTNYGTGIVNFYNMVKAVLEPEYSATPVISVNSDNKFEITAPEETDSRIYYTIDGTIPTIDNHSTYTEPLSLRNTYVKTITAVCHENGKFIGEPIEYDMITYDTKTIFCRWTDSLANENEAENAYWQSYNSEIVSVDSDGNITGKSKGTTRVTCILQTGERIIYKVNVKYSPLQAFFVMFFFGFLWI